MPTRCLRLAVPVYYKRHNVYELSHCAAHDVWVASNASAKLVLEIAKRATKHAPAIVCCAGDAARISGVTHELLKYEKYDPETVGPKCMAPTIAENDHDVITWNESCIVTTSQFGTMLCPVFDHHTAFKRVVPSSCIAQYMQNVALLQHKTMARLIRHIVVVELNDIDCSPSTVRPCKRHKPAP